MCHVACDAELEKLIANMEAFDKHDALYDLGLLQPS